MDLFETNEFLDQSLIFQEDQSSMIEDFLQDLIINNNTESDERVHVDPDVVDQSAVKELDDHQISDDDMASVFLDWLRSNKESISAEDLRTVKIKKSTIESAARRLGGGKEAMKQLLKLVLEWVQTNHISRRRSLSNTPPFQPSDHRGHVTTFPGFGAATPNPSSGQLQYGTAEKSNPNNRYFFTQSTPWPHSQPSFYDPLTSYVVPTASPPPPPPPQQQLFYQSPAAGAGFVGDPFSTGSGYYPPESNSRVRVIDFSQSRPYSSSSAYPQYSQVPDHNVSGFGFGSGHYDPNNHGQYYNAPVGGGEKRLGKFLGSSAAAAVTKEARKKRMARQRSWLMMSSTHHQNQAVDLDLVKYRASSTAAAASTSTSSSTVASSSGPSNVDTSDFVAGGRSATEGREESEVSSTTEF